MTSTQAESRPRPKNIDSLFLAMIVIGLMIAAIAGIASLSPSVSFINKADMTDNSNNDITYVTPDNSNNGITYITPTPNTNTDPYNYDYQYVNVRVSYSGQWSGSIGSISSSSSYDGSGFETIKVWNDDSYMFIVSAVIQKRDSGSGTLAVDIVSPSGTVLQTASTSAQYGVVAVSWSQTI